MLNKFIALGRKAVIISLDCLFLAAALAIAVPFVLVLALPLVIAL